MKFNKYIYSLALASILSLGATAQVTIGTDKKPLDGALLDLKDKETTPTDDSTASKGLGLPRVALTNKAQLFPMFKAKNPADLSEGYKDYDKNDEDKTHIGLLVYNANEVDGEVGGVETPDDAVLCKGLHVWDGKKWHPIVPYPSIPGTASPLPSVPDAGRVGTLVDIRTNTTTGVREFNKYNIASFASENVEVLGQKYVSCDEANLRPDVQIKGEYAGVWMTQSLATRLYPDGTEIPYNASAGVMDASYGYPSVSSMEKPFYRWEKEQGLLYTWVAASKGENPSIIDQSWGNEASENPFTKALGANEVESTGGKIQGICPKGWHLPSDRELSQLIYVIRQNPSAYGEQGSQPETLPTGSLDAPASTGAIGTVLKSALSLTDHTYGASTGLSKSSWQGGFNFLLAGNAVSGSAHSYGDHGSLGSSSSLNGQYAWNRFVYSSLSQVVRDGYDRAGLFSVRCKKD